MQVLNHQVHLLDPHYSHPVLEFHCTQEPDAIALEIAKRMVQKSLFQIKKMIVIAHLSLSHKRLQHTENLVVLFLFKQKDTKLKLSKACLQHNSIQKLSTYAECEECFQSTNHNKFLLHFTNNSVSSPSIQDFLELKPIHIPKPWGQEIWYSGIESRGVSDIKLNKQIVPISWILGTFPNLIFGKKHGVKDPILLKILDPLAEPVKGDLYYETHLEKNEVYIVTALSKLPGQIKIGINPEKLKLYLNHTDNYKADFLKSILKYEAVRREIDALTDQNKKINLNLSENEAFLRKEMDDFCGYKSLNVGDVISVPTRVPHALQHGVQVIEFQTPVYERLIISFAQKVLTQSHWDTKRAFNEIKVEPFKEQKLKILSQSSKILRERVCKFIDFKVERWTMNAKAEIRTTAKPFYRIVFVISGNCFINNKPISPQNCILIPQKQSLSIKSKTKTVLLLCEPQLSISK